MATYTKRKSKWRAQVRRKGISKSAEFDTKAEAQKWATSLEKEIETGFFDPNKYITFSDVIDRYIHEVTIKKGGARPERLRLQRIADTDLGNKLIAKLSVQDLQQWQDQRMLEVKPNSVIRERISLSAVLKKAIQWGYITASPFDKVDKPKEPPARHRRYTTAEIENLISASGYNPEHPPKTKTERVGAAILFAIETAMRAGEICGLTWENVDLTKRTAYLPKTKNGHPRTVPLTLKAVAILNHLTSVKSEKDDTVFQVNVGVLGSLFQKIKTKAGLADADLHFHDTRREALSRLSQKVEVLTLAKISGHRDIKILLNTYYAPDMAEIAQQLD
ncbi:MAG: site-specific integrase [Pasteurellaceae bacterium]|nr:site-specific integrase [Pasteurellaceae bacterium]